MQTAARSFPDIANVITSSKFTAPKTQTAMIDFHIAQRSAFDFLVHEPMAAVTDENEQADNRVAMDACHCMRSERLCLPKAIAGYSSP
jgi:hydrogenase maturation factor HypE